MSYPEIMYHVYYQRRNSSALNHYNIKEFLHTYIQLQTITEIKALLVKHKEYTNKNIRCYGRCRETVSMFIILYDGTTVWLR